MTDMFENTILCNDCNRQTNKGRISRDGFEIRVAECKHCNKKWYHPLDMAKYQNFKKIRDKSFQVKLRPIGNSWCVSIPREIIEFRKIERQMNKMIYMALEEPEKLTLFFTKRIRKIMEE